VQYELLVYYLTYSKDFIKNKTDQHDTSET